MSARSDQVKTRPGHLAAQNGELVAEHQDLRILREAVHG